MKTLLGALLLIVMLSTPAFADATTTIDLGPIKAQLIEIVVAVIAGLGAWLGLWVRKLIGDSIYSSLLHAGLQRGVDYVIAQARLKGEELDLGRIEVKNRIIADVGNYMVVNSPAVLKWFDLDGDSHSDMADLIVGKLPKPTQ